MKQKYYLCESGFTMMEVLLSIAIILVLGSILVTATNTAFKGSARINKTLRNAQVLNNIDRNIRTCVDNLHIPYWENPDPYITSLTNKILTLNSGSIKSVRMLYDRQGNKKGIEAHYSVDNIEMRTIALFPSKIMVEQ